MSHHFQLKHCTHQLFGRSSEAELLRAHCKKAAKGPVAAFVRGPSGSGKSFMIKSVFDSASGGSSPDFFFLSGKFDQYQSGDAHGILVDAFSGLSREAEKQSLSDSVELKDFLNNNKALLQVIPNLQAGMSASISSDDTSSDGGEGSGWGFELLKIMLRDFLKKLCKVRKTILFLDDLQWCDRSYTDLISSLLNDPELTGFMIVGSIRTEDAIKMRDSSIRKTTDAELKSLEKLPCSTTISLSNLNTESCNELICHLLRLEPEVTKELTAVVHKKTYGNPFFVTQFIQMLERSKLIWYSLPHASWQFDVARISGETNLADNVVDAVVAEIMELPFSAQQVLKVAACLGGRFDPVVMRDLIRDLATSTNSQEWSDTEESMLETLELCSREELVAAVSMNVGGDANRDFYKFTHDKIQQASYMLIAPDDRPAFHLLLGRALRNIMRQSESDVLLLIATRQLNHGSFLIENSIEKLQLAQLNLTAAKTLRIKSAFFPASDFIDSSLELIGKRWEDQYELYLETLTTGAELDYCCGRLERCQLRLEEILSHAKTLQDKLRAYFKLVDVYTLKRDYPKALSIGYDLLKQYGFNVARKGRFVPVTYEFLKTLRILRKKSDEEILDLPVSDDERANTTIKMMQLLISAAYWSNQDFQYGYMVVIMMKLTLKRGLTGMSPAVFSAFAGACAAMGDFELAKRVGGLGKYLDLTIGDKLYRSKSMIQYLVFVGAAKKSYYLNLDSFLEGHRIGLQVGDLDHSSLCSFSYVIAYYLAGLPLESMVSDANMFSNRMIEYGQCQQLAMLKLYHQLALNLMGNASGSATRLEGEAIPKIDEHLYSDATSSERRLQFYSGVNLQLVYYFRDFELALAAAKVNESFQDKDWPGYHAQGHPFFRALVWMEAANRGDRRRRYTRKARKCIKKMEKGAKQGMVNLYQLCLIANAEYDTLTFDKSKVAEYRAAYDKAATECTRSGFTQHAALTYELAGRFMLRSGDKDWGLYYVDLAIEKYCDWGADGKADQLSEEFSIPSKSRRKGRRESQGIRGRARFEESDDEEMHKGHGSDDLWPLASSQLTSS